VTALLILLTVLGFAAVKPARKRWPEGLARALLVVGILGPIAALLATMWLLWNRWFDWRSIALFLVLWVLTGFGITIGFHRFLTHRSFETGPVLTFILLGLGSMANQGRCLDWAAHHLKHHAYSDKEGDPHSPLEGLAHAYCGWLIRGTRAERERYCKRLLENRMIVLSDRLTALWVILGLVVPFAIAGWQGLVWGGLARIGFTNHAAFSVNSLGHTFGKQPFATGDRSRNNWILATFSFGDGWHNNHHAFPAMASHGMSRGQFDPAGLVIRGLARLGLVWNVKTAPDARAIERRLRIPTGAAPAAPPSEGVVT
jgi:stearoyl-CoA desaturase (delta-9 desaturase)